MTWEKLTEKRERRTRSVKKVCVPRLIKWSFLGRLNWCPFQLTSSRRGVGRRSRDEDQKVLIDTDLTHWQYVRGGYNSMRQLIPAAAATACARRRPSVKWAKPPPVIVAGNFSGKPGYPSVQQSFLPVRWITLSVRSLFLHWMLETKEIESFIIFFCDGWWGYISGTHMWKLLTNDDSIFKNENED